MRSTFLSAVLGAILLSPIAASAARIDDLQLELMQLLGRFAAQKAQVSDISLACALVATKSSVATREPFALIWNTVGAEEPSNGDTASRLAPAGITTLVLDKPGSYKYELEFYGNGGVKTKCSTKVTVRTP